MKYSPNKFYQMEQMINAHEVEMGDLILLSNLKHFSVDDIDSFFVDDKLSELYGDTDKVKPEHSKYTFYDECRGNFKNEKEFSEIPYDAKFVVFRRVVSK